jgi:hypothetical protein
MAPQTTSHWTHLVLQMRTVTGCLWPRFFTRMARRFQLGTGSGRFGRRSLVGIPRFDRIGTMDRSRQLRLASVGVSLITPYASITLLLQSLCT